MDERIQKAKNKLLELGYLDNEWMSKYLEMLEANLYSRLIRGRTQEHHAIPTSSYRIDDNPRNAVATRRLAESDEANFKVNLLYKDHLKIHSYLTLCTDLDKIQEQYEAQAELRKRNSSIGVAATNNKHKQANKKQTDPLYIELLNRLERLEAANNNIVD